VKRILFILLVAAGLAATAPSASGYTGYVYGYALEDNGARCGNDCLAVIYSRNTGITRTGAVSNGYSTCNGHTYNFGGPGVPCININDRSTFFGTGGTIDVWIRHNCPFSGFYFSQTKSYTLSFDFQLIWADTFQLQKPNGGCFTAAATAGLRPTVLAIETGFGAWLNPT
jgi:hypothetical protein